MLAHSEMLHQVGEHHGVEHYVESIEEPAEAAGDKRAALGESDVARPFEAEDFASGPGGCV